MYLRLSTVRRGSRTYRYAQLVESVRRPDGVPTNRVLANLGALDDLAIENLRAALGASRAGRAVASAEAPVDRAAVHANWRYLDLAVLLRVLRAVGVTEVLASALPVGERTVPTADVVAALVLQRCVAPGSKLAAERWFPTTALPELLGIAPAQFNNSRIHRALEAVEEGEDALQAALAPRVRSGEGAFTALFVDATDTWFEGRGPPMAAKATDKEGIYRRRIGIVMLCDQRGLPLRWKTLSGNYHDGNALLEMAREAAKLPWANGLPLTMDRAVGHAGATEQLHAAGLHYVTALPDPELESSGAPIPWTTLDALQGDSVEGMAATLAGDGFERTGDRFVRDLGLFEKTHSASASRRSMASAALEVVLEIERGPSSAAVADRVGINIRSVQRHRPLTSLAAAVRARLLQDDDRVNRLSFDALLGLARLPAEAQPAALERLLAEGGMRCTARGRGEPTYPCRAVLCVNPERVRSDRDRDEAHVAVVEAEVDDLNRRLSHKSNRRTDASALTEVEVALRKYGLRGVFTPGISGTGTERRITLDKDADAWARRRRGDGVCLVVSHPAVKATAEELVRQYFAKDAIEKDFQTIKSCVELRPVHHRTDAKVRAHVTLCVLAVLLQRALQLRLAGTPYSPGAAIEAMEPIRLNQLVQGKNPFYTVTRPGPAILDLLARLSATDLIDDTKVNGSLHPR